MEEFLQFLKASKESFLAFERNSINRKFQIVLGNESCDLDSTVSTLVLAYWLNTENTRKCQCDLTVLPILNVQKCYFHLRTLSYHLLESAGVSIDSLIFRNEIDMKSIKPQIVETFLVDHHILSKNDYILNDTIVEIIDHRPISLQTFVLSSNAEKSSTSTAVLLRKLIINAVGSCCTLITNQILNSLSAHQDSMVLCDQLLYLLYATIIFDTIGLEEQHGRTTALDLCTATKLEALLNRNANITDKYNTANRSKLFEEFWKYHNDTSKLSALDLLHKDVKFAGKIPICALPQLVSTYLNSQNSIGSILETSLQEFSCDLIILLGICVDIEVMNQRVRRDVGIYHKNPVLKDVIISKLMKNGSDLQLQSTPIENTKIPNVYLFEQLNTKLTRKFILPLVMEVTDNLASNV